jgi:hypothetical protein
LVHRDRKAQPSREREIRRMLSAKDAADALRLEDELDERRNGFG